MNAETRRRVREIGKALAIPDFEVSAALQSEGQLLAFARRYGQSLDWIVDGDATATVRIMARGSHHGRRRISYLPRIIRDGLRKSA